MFGAKALISFNLAVSSFYFADFINILARNKQKEGGVRLKESRKQCHLEMSNGFISFLPMPSFKSVRCRLIIFT